MRLKFIGNGDNDPASVTVQGVEFPKNKAISVDDEALIAKLRGNSHFAVAKGRPSAKDDA